MRTAIDTNIISALWSRGPDAVIAAELLNRARLEGGLVVSGFVRAELYAHPTAGPTDVEAFLDRTGITVELDLSEAAWREAGLAYRGYAERRRSSGGGSPRRLLVDFLVGAHALDRADRLLTLDPERYRSGFPGLALIP